MAGRRPVEEAFVARRPASRLLVTPQRRTALEKIVLHATSLRIPIVEVEGGTLTALTGFDGHQGVALVVGARRYATLDDVLARAAERGEPPFVLALDSLEDPQNVGTLLRSAEAAGAHGVVFPTHRQAPLTPAAVKASAGAVEHLLLVPVDDLAAALADLHIRGLRVAGAEAEAPLTARQADLRGPLVLVVGSEGQGLGPTVRRRCDLVVRIPMRGAIGSLNAAVAGSILLFEALAQRDDGSSTATAHAPATSAPTPAEPSAEAAETKTPAEEKQAPAGATAKKTRARKAAAGTAATDERPVTETKPAAKTRPAAKTKPVAKTKLVQKKPADQKASAETKAPAKKAARAGKAAPDRRPTGAAGAASADDPNALLPGGPAPVDPPS